MLPKIGVLFEECTRLEPLMESTWTSLPNPSSQTYSSTKPREVRSAGKANAPEVATKATILATNVERKATGLVNAVAQRNKAEGGVLTQGNPKATLVAQLVPPKNPIGAVFLHLREDLKPSGRMATPSTGVESAAIGTRRTSPLLMFVVPLLVMSTTLIVGQLSISHLTLLLGLSSTNRTPSTKSQLSLSVAMPSALAAVLPVHIANRRSKLLHLS